MAKKSSLGNIVTKDGLSALTTANQNKINISDLKPMESADIDEHFRAGEPNETRWDYYIGFQKKGEMYLEVHKVNEDELSKLISKAEWLQEKIRRLSWPQTEGRPFFVAPTAGIPLSPASLYGALSRSLALKKIAIIRKGDEVKSFF